MSKKIIGATVATTLSVSAIKDRLNLDASDIYVGADTPPADASVWINPNGIPTGTEEWEFDLTDGTTKEKTVVVIGADEASGQLGILKLKDKDGNWVEIPAIRGTDGKDGTTPRKGIDYFDGESGVHVGSDTPPENAVVWINPIGEPTATETWEFDLSDGSTEEKNVVVIGSDDATSQGKVAILRMKDKAGNWVEIPAIKGVSPAVKVSKSGKVAKITITDADGEKEVEVSDGADGASVTVKSVSESSEDGGENVVTFSNNKTLKVKNGKTGSPGAPGAPGKDGTSVTVASVTESTEDGGSNVVQFSDGKSLNVKNGKTGAPGNPGKTAYQYAQDGGYAGTEEQFIAELSYLSGLTGKVQTQLNNKANDFTFLLYNSNKGNPNPVKFATFNYSDCSSEHGISAKISMVSGHGNGTSYAFLQDAILKVNYQGFVTVDNFKYYGASAGTYDEATRQYGDIFWVNDTTNKIVDFYVLMGQYARMYQTPWKRLTYSSGGTVTQHTSSVAYSSGEKVWANNSDIALLSDIPAVPTNTDTWTFTLEDGSTVTKAVYVG